MYGWKGRMCAYACVGVSCLQLLCATFIAIQGHAWQREYDFSPFSALPAGMRTPL